MSAKKIQTTENIPDHWPKAVWLTPQEVDAIRLKAEIERRKRAPKFSPECLDLIFGLGRPLSV